MEILGVHQPLKNRLLVVSEFLSNDTMAQAIVTV